MWAPPVAAASGPEWGTGLATSGPEWETGVAAVPGSALVKAQGWVPGQAPVEELGRALAMEPGPGLAEERELVPEPTRPVPPGWP